ncbi:MAG: DUF4115 domain-containing protein [Anaerolineae bacterium]|nr:DUF4115 domain-containing protein [Anaerolineae bacterium]
MSGASDAELLGNELREARQRLNLTLLQAEKQTRIRVKYLEALENGNYGALPSAVHARGFLRSYARFLNLDGDLSVARFDEFMQGGRRRGRKRSNPPTLIDESPRIRNRPRTAQENLTSSTTDSPDMRTLIRTASEEGDRSGKVAGRIALVAGIVALLVIVGVFSFSLFGGSLGTLIPGLVAAQNTPNGGILTPLPQVSNTPADVTPTETLLPTEDLPTPLPNPNAEATVLPTLPPPPPGVGDNVLVELQIEARSWVQILTDGQPTFVGAPAPGTVLRTQGREVKVRVSNAIGVRLLINGVDQGLLGARGEIVDRTYTPEYIILPSPIPTVNAATPTLPVAPPPPAEVTPGGPSA